MIKPNKSTLLFISLTVSTWCNGQAATEDHEIPPSLTSFWEEFVLPFHSHQSKAVFIQAMCWPTEVDYCVMQYAEPLPSGWDSYLAVVKSGAKEPIDELRWGKYDRLLGYQLVFGHFYVSTVSTQVHAESEPQRIKIYQWNSQQFTLLSETQSYNSGK